MIEKILTRWWVFFFKYFENYFQKHLEFSAFFTTLVE